MIPSLTDYGPSSNVVPEQAIWASLETLLIPYGFADLKAPTYLPLPPLILSTYLQTRNAFGRTVTGHLWTPNNCLLDRLWTRAGALAATCFYTFDVAREYIQEGTGVRVTESLNKQAVQMGFRGDTGRRVEREKKDARGCTLIQLIYRPWQVDI